MAIHHSASELGGSGGKTADIDTDIEIALMSNQNTLKDQNMDSDDKNK